MTLQARLYRIAELRVYLRNALDECARLTKRAEAAEQTVLEWERAWWCAHAFPTDGKVGHDFTADAEAIEEKHCTCGMAHLHVSPCPLWSWVLGQ